MKRALITISFSFLLNFSFSQHKEQASTDYLAVYSQALKLFERADLLSGKADIDEKIQKLQDRLYAEALSKLNESLNMSVILADDSLNFHIYIRMGLINHYFS